MSASKADAAQRWWLSRDHGARYIVSPDPGVDEIEVMPVSEHEWLRETVGRALDELDRSALSRHLPGTEILRNALKGEIRS